MIDKVENPAENKRKRGKSQKITALQAREAIKKANASMKNVQPSIPCFGFRVSDRARPLTLAQKGLTEARIYAATVNLLNRY